MRQTLDRPTWHIETRAVPPCDECRWGVLAAVDPVGRTGAVAHLYGPPTARWVGFGLQFGADRPPNDVIRQLVLAAARLAAQAGAERLVVDLPPGGRVLREVVEASGLAWHIVVTDESAWADLVLGANVHHRRAP